MGGLALAVTLLSLASASLTVIVAVRTLLKTRQSFFDDYVRRKEAK